MKLLLDTHALLWYVAGDPQLSTTAENLIEVNPKIDTLNRIAEAMGKRLIIEVASAA